MLQGTKVLLKEC